MNRLGMESGAIADNQITAMNVFDNDINNYGPALARLNSNGKYILFFLQRIRKKNYCTIIMSCLTQLITIRLVILKLLSSVHYFV